MKFIRLDCLRAEDSSIAPSSSCSDPNGVFLAICELCEYGLPSRMSRTATASNRSVAARGRGRRGLLELSWHHKSNASAYHSPFAYGWNYL